MRLVADDQLLAVGLEQKSDVEVFVGREAVVRRDRVNIQVENLRIDDTDVFDTRFFLCLAHRHLNDIALTISMTADLKPAIQLAMVRQ